MVNKHLQVQITVTAGGPGPGAPRSAKTRSTLAQAFIKFGSRPEFQPSDAFGKLGFVPIQK